MLKHATGVLLRRVGSYISRTGLQLVDTNSILDMVKGDELTRYGRLFGVHREMDEEYRRIVKRKLYSVS